MLLTVLLNGFLPLLLSRIYVFGAHFGDSPPCPQELLPLCLYGAPLSLWWLIFLGGDEPSLRRCTGSFQSCSRYIVLERPGRGGGAGGGVLLKEWKGTGHRDLASWRCSLQDGWPWPSGLDSPFSGLWCWKQNKCEPATRPQLPLIRACFLQPRTRWTLEVSQGKCQMCLPQLAAKPCSWLLALRPTSQPPTQPPLVLQARIWSPNQSPFLLPTLSITHPIHQRIPSALLSRFVFCLTTLSNSTDIIWSGPHAVSHGQLQ